VKYKQRAQIAFATGLIGLGIFGLINGDFEDLWQIVPASFPGRQVLEYAAATLVVACGIGLLWKRTEALAARVLFPFLALLVLLFKLPVVVKHPLVEVSWESMSEMLVILTGAWVLFAADKRQLRIAQLVFGLALIPLGFSHFAYRDHTAALIPAWIPFHNGWVYLTGTAHLAAGFGVLLGIYPMLAASMEAAMLTAFTVLVWIPQILAAPTSLANWSEFSASWAISAGAWVVAASFKSRNSETAS